MNPKVTDLRYLKLAEMYEQAYERFVVDVAMRTVKDDGVRAKLLELAPEKDQHAQRIVRLMARLNAELTSEDERAVLRAALLDVLDVERTARDFYLGAMDKVHDREVVKLFTQLAKEERRHVRLAEELLAQVDGATPGVRVNALTEDELDELGSGPFLREGVIDFGSLHHRKPPPAPEP